MTNNSISTSATTKGVTKKCLQSQAEEDEDVSSADYASDPVLNGELLRRLQEIRNATFWPRDQDLQIAMLSLARIQFVYQIDVSASLLRGGVRGEGWRDVLTGLFQLTIFHIKQKRDIWMHGCLTTCSVVSFWAKFCYTRNFQSHIGCDVVITKSCFETRNWACH